MRWLLAAPFLAAAAIAPLIMTGFIQQDMTSGFDLSFVLCTADADGQHIDPNGCMKVHISTPDGSQKMCMAKAPEIIADWMAKNDVKGHAVASWKCMSEGTKLPDDPENSI